MKFSIAVLAFTVAVFSQLSSASFLPGLSLGGDLAPSCLGQTSLQQGNCHTESDCKNSAGFLDGTAVCPLPAGSACCVPSVKCGATANLNNTAWSNTGFPNATTENSKCSITVNILHPLIKTIRLDFDTFIIAQPNSKGECQDKLVIEGAAEKSGVLPLCGDLSGQHLYIQVADGRTNVVLSIVTSGVGDRSWFIRVGLIEDTNPTLPPAGCRQYFWGKLQGKLSSLNFNANGTTKSTLSGVKYAACFRSEAGYCRIQFEPEIFKLARSQPAKREAGQGHYYGQPQPAQQYQPAPYQAQPAPYQHAQPAYSAPQYQPIYHAEPQQPAPVAPVQPMTPPVPVVATTLAPNASTVVPTGLPVEASKSCAGLDKVGLPPSNDPAIDTSIFCNNDFNKGKPYPASEAPFIVYYESGADDKHGLGYILKYSHLVC